MTGTKVLSFRKMDESRLKSLEVSIRWAELQGLVRRRDDVPQDCLGILVAEPKGMTEEAKAFFATKAAEKAKRKAEEEALLQPKEVV